MPPMTRPPSTPWIALPRPPKRLVAPMTAAGAGGRGGWPRAAEEAGPADDRGGDGVEDELTGVRRVRAELAVEERAEQDPGDPRGDRAEDENPGPDGRQAHAGSSGCFGIAADGVDIAAEAGPLEQERPGAKHGEDD